MKDVILILFVVSSTNGCGLTGEDGAFCRGFEEHATLCAQTQECSADKLGCKCLKGTESEYYDDTLVARFPVPKACFTNFSLSDCCITVKELKIQCEDYSDSEYYCAERYQCDETNNILVSTGENCE